MIATDYIALRGGSKSPGFGRGFFLWISPEITAKRID
jgi:hypothetical protein